VSGFTTIWSLIAQRSMANWRMATILAVGILVAATLLASAPIYARAMNDLGVTFSIRDTLEDDPGIRVIFLETELSTDEGEANIRSFEERIDERLGWFRDSQTRIVASSNFRIDLGDEPLSDTAPRGRAYSLQGWESHVQIIEGALPAAVGPDEPLQVALHERGAEIAGLSVGDSFRLVERFDNCQRAIPQDEPPPPPPPCFQTATASYSFPAVLTAIVGAIDEDDPFWFPSYRTYFVSPGAMVPNTGVVVQMFMPEESLLEGIGGRFPTYTGRVTWNVTAEPELINSSNFERARDDILGLHGELREAGGVAFSGLTSTLAGFSRSQNFQQVPLTILLLEIAGIALFYTGLVASIVVERQADEIALLRGRGASVWQILGIYLTEGLTLGIPVALAAPFVAAAATSLLGLTPIFDDVSGGALLPTRVVPMAFAWSAVGVLLSIGTILAPALIVARRGSLAQKRAISRPGPSIIQRYYLDFALVVLAALMLWELNQRGSVFEPSSTGGVTSDPILLASPALIIAAAAAMIVRFYPMVLRLFAGVVTRISGVTLSMGMWQVVRSPGQYTRLALLLMMAVAVGTFAASYRSTTDRSYDDRARFEAGADLRGTSPAQLRFGSGEQMDVAVEEIPGVISASAVMRIPGSQVSGGSSSRAVKILGIERELAELAWFREDFADVPIAELLEPLGGPGPFTGLPLPDGSTGIEVWVNSLAIRADVSLWVRVRDRNDRYVSFQLTELDQTGWQRTEVVFDPPGAALEQPLTLVALLVTQPSNRFNATDDPLFIDDLSVVNEAGELTLVEDFEAGRSWSTVPKPNPNDDDFNISDEEANTGSLSARLGFSLGPTEGRRGIFVSEANVPLPAIASSQFVQSTGVGVGGVTFIEFAGGLVPVTIRGVYDLFPTLATREGPSLLLNRDHLMAWGDTFQTLPGSLAGPNEVWVSLEDGADTEFIASQMLLRERGSFTRTTSLAETLDQIQSNPLIAASGQGILMVAFLSVMGLVGAALLLSLWMAVQRRRVEFAVLRALGLARSQILGLLVFEYSLVAIVGTVTGGYLGRIVGRRMLSFLDITESGLAVEPSFVLETDWLFVGAGAVGVLVVFAGALLLAARVLSRTSDAQALRTE
jgi:FtsX-like permease family